MAFECTSKPRPRTAAEPRLEARHDAWWEYEVQAAIRTLRPPLSGQDCRRLLLGCRDQHLIAVSLYVELDGLEEIELELMAISLLGRHRGGGFADEMCAVTLDQITAA